MPFCVLLATTRYALVGFTLRLPLVAFAFTLLRLRPVAYCRLRLRCRLLRVVAHVRVRYVTAARLRLLIYVLRLRSAVAAFAFARSVTLYRSVTLFTFTHHTVRSVRCVATGSLPLRLPFARGSHATAALPPHVCAVRMDLLILVLVYYTPHAFTGLPVPPSLPTATRCLYLFCPVTWFAGCVAVRAVYVLVALSHAFYRLPRLRI